MIHSSINIIVEEQVINLLLEMKTIGENNMTFLESEFNDARSYTGLILFVLLYATLIIVYTLWIITIPLKIKKHMRKREQLRANVLASTIKSIREKRMSPVYERASLNSDSKNVMLFSPIVFISSNKLITCSSTIIFIEEWINQLLHLSYYKSKFPFLAILSFRGI